MKIIFMSRSFNLKKSSGSGRNVMFTCCEVQKIFCEVIPLRDRSLFRAEGGWRKMTFYRKTFQGPLGAETKHFAANSASCDNFSVPTLGQHNWHKAMVS